MKFDEARFGRLLSGLGLSSLTSSGKIIRLYQGKSDTVVFDGDVLYIEGADIREVKLVSGKPKLSFQELESIIGLSERIKTAGFPSLELDISINGKITGVSGKLLERIPAFTGKADELVGLPASPGQSKGECLVLPENQEIAGKIIVLKNSHDLFLLIRQKPSGIILEEGNLLSHASILAREAKIPAVVKVQDATKKLKSGETIALDATRGIISRV